MEPAAQNRLSSVNGGAVGQLPLARALLQEGCPALAALVDSVFTTDGYPEYDALEDWLLEEQRTKDWDRFPACGYGDEIIPVWRASSAYREWLETDYDIDFDA